MASNTEMMSLESTVDATHLHYIGMIMDQPLLWDDRQHQPVWPEGEPARELYEATGGITVEPVYDVYQAWWHGTKALDCGHGVSYPAIYLTDLAANRDICLACAQEATR